MFKGSHMVIFSADPEADRALFKTLFPENPIDAHEGWMIYKMPPAEIAVHPIHGPIRHELHMMCDRIEETCKALEGLGFECDPVEDLGYGLVSGFTLPGGAKLGFYQPTHQTAIE